MKRIIIAFAILLTFAACAPTEPEAPADAPVYGPALPPTPFVCEPPINYAVIMDRKWEGTISVNGEDRDISIEFDGKSTVTFVHPDGTRQPFTVSNGQNSLPVAIDVSTKELDIILLATIEPYICEGVLYLEPDGPVNQSAFNPMEAANSAVSTFIFAEAYYSALSLHHGMTPTSLTGLVTSCLLFPVHRYCVLKKALNFNNLIVQKQINI